MLLSVCLLCYTLDDIYLPTQGCGNMLTSQYAYILDVSIHDNIQDRVAPFSPSPKEGKKKPYKHK